MEYVADVNNKIEVAFVANTDSSNIREVSFDGLSENVQGVEFKHGILRKVCRYWYTKDVTLLKLATLYRIKLYIFQDKLVQVDAEKGGEFKLRVKKYASGVGGNFQYKGDGRAITLILEDGLDIPLGGWTFFWRCGIQFDVTGIVDLNLVDNVYFNIEYVLFSDSARMSFIVVDLETRLQFYLQLFSYIGVNERDLGFEVDFRGEFIKRYKEKLLTLLRTKDANSIYFLDSGAREYKLLSVYSIWLLGSDADIDKVIQELKERVAL